MTISNMSRRLLLIGAAILIVLAGLVGLAAYRSGQTTSLISDTYQPTQAEIAMFAHLRHASPSQAQDASNALAPMRYDMLVPGHYDVYVAQSSFRTIYTDHPMIIMMRPGVKWLGGQLGHIWLLAQGLLYENIDLKAHPQLKQGQDLYRHFVGSTILYDPFCRAVELAVGTIDACRATAQQRLALGGDHRLQILLPTPNPSTYGLRPFEQYDWTTPVSQLTYLTPLAEVAPPQYTVLTQLSQHIGGGQFGNRKLFTLTMRKVYQNVSQFSLVPVSIIDPLIYYCIHDPEVVKTYFGSDAIAQITQYKQYCQ